MEKVGTGRMEVKIDKASRDRTVTMASVEDTETGPTMDRAVQDPAGAVDHEVTGPAMDREVAVSSMGRTGSGRAMKTARTTANTSTDSTMDQNRAVVDRSSTGVAVETGRYHDVDSTMDRTGNHNKRDHNQHGPTDHPAVPRSAESSRGAVQPSVEDSRSRSHYIQGSTRTGTGMITVYAVMTAMGPGTADPGVIADGDMDIAVAIDTDPGPGITVIEDMLPIADGITAGGIPDITIQDPGPEVHTIGPEMRVSDGRVQPGMDYQPVRCRNPSSWCQQFRRR